MAMWQPLSPLEWRLDLSVLTWATPKRLAAAAQLCTLDASISLHWRDEPSLIVRISEANVWPALEATLTAWVPTVVNVAFLAYFTSPEFVATPLTQTMLHAALRAEGVRVTLEQSTPDIGRATIGRCIAGYGLEDWVRYTPLRTETASMAAGKPICGLDEPNPWITVQQVVIQGQRGGGLALAFDPHDMYWIDEMSTLTPASVSIGKLAVTLFALHGKVTGLRGFFPYMDIRIFGGGCTIDVKLVPGMIRIVSDEPVDANALLDVGRTLAVAARAVAGLLLAQRELRNWVYIAGPPLALSLAVSLEYAPVVSFLRAEGFGRQFLDGLWTPRHMLAGVNAVLEKALDPDTGHLWLRDMAQRHEMRRNA